MKRTLLLFLILLPSLALAQDHFFYLEEDCSSRLSDGKKSYIIDYPGQSKDSLLRNFSSAVCSQQISSFETVQVINGEILVADIFKPMSLHHGDALTKINYGVVYTVRFRFSDNAVEVLAPGIKCLLLGENVNYNPQSFMHVQEIITKGKAGKNKNSEIEYKGLNSDLNSCVQDVINKIEK